MRWYIRSELHHHIARLVRERLTGEYTLSTRLAGRTTSAARCPYEPVTIVGSLPPYSSSDAAWQRPTCISPRLTTSYITIWHSRFFAIPDSVLFLPYPLARNILG